jgi:hypothetical protein
MSHRLEATYYRTALLLGLIPGDAVHRWAERIIDEEATPQNELLELVSIPVSDLSALRLGLWPLAVEPEPEAVLRAILGLVHADLTDERRTTEDTVTVLRQMRSMLRLPAPMYSELNEALVSHGLAKPTGGTIGVWLQQFATADLQSLGSN